MAKRLISTVIPLLAVIPLSVFTGMPSAAQDLQSFGVISGQSLTNTGPTTIVGNIALNPGTSYTGYGSVTHTGSVYLADPVAIRVQNDLSTLYGVLAGRPTSNGGNLTGQDLGGMTLTGGVYNFDSSAGIAAGQTLILDGGGNPDTIFIFNIGSTLTTGSGARVLLENGAQGGNVFYRVGSSATLDTSSVLEGQIVALTSITMNTAASVNCGAALARNGSVTLDTNTIRICTLAAPGFDTVITDPTLTENDRAVATALSGYVAGGGILPLGIAIIAATQTPAELAVSLAQLSGQVSTSVAPTGMQATNDFLDTFVRTGRTPRTTPQPSRNDGVPVGMVREKINAAYTGKYGSEPTRVVETLSYPERLSPRPRNWDMWVSGYGSRNTTDGSARLGHSERTSTNRGIAVGLNVLVNEATNVGVALSWSRADFALSENMGSGTSDTVLLGLRARTSSDRGYLEGALAFGRSDISTDRTVTIAGLDRLGAETTGNSFAAHVEAGYHMGVFTPFAALRAQSFRTAAYSESAVSGSDSFALGYDAATTTSVRSELGVDMQWSTTLADGGARSFGVRAAWGHEFASNTPGTRSFVALPGALVAVSGATPGRDSILLSANMGLATANGVTIDGGVNVAYSNNARDFGGSIKLGYRW
ncbi:MAG: ice-binding family protein [Paracoccaceae bacterium]